MAPRQGRPKGNGIVWPSAKAVYTLRACAVLAAAFPDRLLKAEEIARASKAPVRFLSKILGELRVAGLVSARRGYHGGYALVRDPNETLISEVLVAVGSLEILVPLPPQLQHPRSVFVDDLRRNLAQVAFEAFDRVTLAQLTFVESAPTGVAR